MLPSGASAEMRAPDWPILTEIANTAATMANATAIMIPTAAFIEITSSELA